MELFDLDFGLVVRQFAQLLVAFLLSFPIAWDREREARSAGMRTFPLVAVASCGFILLSRAAYPTDPGAEARILQGVITGIGFIGGGAIVKSNGSTVHGTATAASVWATGAVGAAVAYGRYEIALVVSTGCFGILRWLGRLKETARKSSGRDPADG